LVSEGDKKKKKERQNLIGFCRGEGVAGVCVCVKKGTKRV